MLSIIDSRPFPALPSSLNLAEEVLAAGQATPDKPALEILHPDRAGVWSYARLTATIRGCGTALTDQGLHPGDRVLIRLGKTAAFPILYLGAIAAGLVPVATSAALTAAEVTHMATLTTPRLIIADPGLALPAHPAPVIPPDLALWQSLPPCPFHQGDPNREGYIVFTSGTSRHPLAVSHAHRAILARRAMHQGWEGLTRDDRLLHAGAFNWTYTLGTGLLDPWTLGATALVPADGTPDTALVSLLHRANATIFAAVPGIYRQILRHTLPPLPHLRHGLSAGESLAAPTRAAWRTATGCDIHEALGMSEISTYLSGAPSRPAPEGSCGYVQQGRHAALLDATGTPVPRGTSGTLALSTDDPGLMRGYIGHPAPAGDWFLTGDIASMAPDGALTSLGRMDDLINPGGFRIAPQEVEAAFLSFPGLVTCAVTELEPTPGTRILACFYESPTPLDPASLAAHASANLARWKQPRVYHHLDKLPRAANGKLIRRALANLAPKEGP